MVARLSSIPLTLRLSLTVVALMSVLGLAASVVVLRALTMAQASQLRTLAELEFDGIRTSATPLLIRDDIWELFDLLDRVTHRMTGLRPVEAHLVDAYGRVTVSTKPEQFRIGSNGNGLLSEAVPLNAPDFPIDREVTLIKAALEGQGRSFGHLIIGFDVRELVSERARTWKWLIAGNIGATLVLALAGYLVAVRALHPVSRLIKQMGIPGGVPQPVPAAEIPVGDTETARLYRSYNRMLRAVEERNAAERRLADRERFVSLGRLAGTLAHEVNNPLGGLLNAVDTLRTYPDRPDVVSRNADLLDRGLRHLRDVVRVTLDTHRQARGDVPLLPVDFDDLQTLIRPEAERRNQTLIWEIGVTPDCLTGLPAGPVRQVVLNLLLNASAVSGKGGQFGLMLHPTEKGLALVVRDSGKGMPAELRTRLLSDDPIEPGGGLGLRLVRDLVTAMGGEVSLGEPSGGLKDVIVLLPCSKKKTRSHASRT